MATSSRKNRAAEMAAQLAQYSALPVETTAAPPLPVSRTRVLANIHPETPPVAISPQVPEPETMPSVPIDRVRQWRTQGVTVYPSDDERVDRLAQFFKARRVRFGRRGNLSLLIGAGLAELDRLRDEDPDALIAIVTSTMHERAESTT
jgi:hypothetical protein